jgi:hypothetical protein
MQGLSAKFSSTIGSSFKGPRAMLAPKIIVIAFWVCHIYLVQRNKCVQEDMELRPSKVVDGHEYQLMIVEYRAKGSANGGEGVLLTLDAYMLPLIEASALPNACTPP